MSVHRFRVRVYYEDTDLAGIVYYANYLKFIERGRSEWLRDLGVDQARLKADRGIVFAVRRVEADYLRPAHFDDLLDVETETEVAAGARMTLQQRVVRAGETIFVARVTVVALGEGGAPMRLPADIRRLLADSSGKNRL